MSDIEGILEQAVVSSASRTASQTASTAPATTVTITADELRRHGIHSLDEALNFFAPGMVAESPRETVEVGARGVLLTSDYGTHVLLVVDGHVVNEPWGGTGYFDRGAGVPFEAIDRIEVMMGPGSVLYGSNAMLGVIHIITKRARDFAGVRLVTESELPISIRAMAGFGHEFELRRVKFELTAAAEYYASHGPGSSFGPQRYGIDSVTGQPKRFSSKLGATGIWSSEGNPNQFFSQAPSGYVRLVAGGLELGLRAALWRRWNPYISGEDLADPRGQERDRWVSFDARYRVSVSPVVRLSARLYGDLYDYLEALPIAGAEDCLEGQTRGCLYELNGRARWLGSELSTTLDWLKDNSIVTLVGLEGRLRDTKGAAPDYVDAATSKRVSSGAPYGAVEKAAAAYAEQTARLGQHLHLNAGARLDADERFGWHLSPRVAAVVSPWRDGHLKALYAEAFRAPSAYERYATDPLYQVVAQGLRPETVRSIEASFEQRFGTNRLLVTVFRTWWKDLVVNDYLSEAELEAAKRRHELEANVTSANQFRNASSIDNFGASLVFEGASFGRRLRYGLSVTGAHARRSEPSDATTTRLPAAAQLSGNGRVSYELGGAWPTLALAGRFTGPRLVADTSFVPVPTVPGLLELRATVSGPVPHLRNLTYRLSANVLPIAGNPYGVGPLSLPQPGFRTQETAQLDRFRITAGFQYHLPL